MKVKNTPKGISWITISLLLSFSFGIRAQESVDLIIWARQSNAQEWQGEKALESPDGNISLKLQLTESGSNSGQ